MNKSNKFYDKNGNWRTWSVGFSQSSDNRILNPISGLPSQSKEVLKHSKKEFENDISKYYKTPQSI